MLFGSDIRPLVLHEWTLLTVRWVWGQESERFGRCCSRCLEGGLLNAVLCVECCNLIQPLFAPPFPAPNREEALRAGECPIPLNSNKELPPLWLPQVGCSSAECEVGLDPKKGPTFIAAGTNQVSQLVRLNISVCFAEEIKRAVLE